MCYVNKKGLFSWCLVFRIYYMQITSILFSLKKFVFAILFLLSLQIDFKTKTNQLPNSISFIDSILYIFKHTFNPYTTSCAIMMGTGSVTDIGLVYIGRDYARSCDNYNSNCYQIIYLGHVSFYCINLEYVNSTIFQVSKE